MELARALRERLGAVNVLEGAVEEKALLEAMRKVAAPESKEKGK